MVKNVWFDIELSVFFSQLHFIFHIEIFLLQEELIDDGFVPEHTEMSLKSSTSAKVGFQQWWCL